MEIYRKEWKKLVFKALCGMAPEPDLVKKNVSPADILTETPPDPALGDIAFPLFPFAKIMKQAPAAVGEKLAARLQGQGGSVSVSGPYLNVKLERNRIFEEVLENVAGGGDTYGANESLSGQRTAAFSIGILCESVCICIIRSNSTSFSFRVLIMFSRR